MAIASRVDLANAMAGGQLVQFVKLFGTSSQQVNGAWTSLFTTAGNPAAGTLPGTSTTAGVVPVSGNAGFPTINGAGAGNTLYLGGVQLTPTPNAVSQSGIRFRLVDMLWKGGAYPFNAAVTLSAQPSYSSRIPGGDYKGTEIWFEAGNTTFVSNPTVTVTYTNQDGVAGQSTTLNVGTIPAAGRLFQFPLAAGDTGVQKIESVTCTVSTAGNFNILVFRPLWHSHVQSWGTEPGANGDLVHGPDLTGLPILFPTSALFVQVSACLVTTVGAFDATFTIIQG